MNRESRAWKRLTVALSVLLCAQANPQASHAAELVGRAVLPAATFAPGPTSGAHLGGTTFNGQNVPWTHAQPIQGFSSVLAEKDGSFLVLCDNGYGSLENSADFRLRLYRVRPHFKTAQGGAGTLALDQTIELRDPDQRLPFVITEAFTSERFLTGADLDPESLQRAPDGTLWIGDEFGPFLVHTDATGRILEAPIAMPDPDQPERELRSPQNPLSEEGAAVRVMNAMRHHAAAQGSSLVPICAPDYRLIDDEDPATGTPDRLNPPPGSGLAPASSDLFNIKSLQTAGFPVVAWTVNEPGAMQKLLGLRLNGLISDRPDLLLAAVRAFDANGDGRPGDLLTAEGLIDRSKFDAQGHRGARGLRPENTLPAMEAALDHLMTTLETDCGVTRDGVAVLSHDPYLLSGKVRSADGRPYNESDEVLLRELSVEEIQSRFIADRISQATQTNDPRLSPVSLAYFGLAAEHRDAASVYRIPTVAQLFDFVAFYERYYSSGPGAQHSEALLRANNARHVRFNIEAKLNPRTDTDEKGRVYRDRTVEPHAMVHALGQEVTRQRLEERVDIQSFDFRSLLEVHRQFPRIRTACLFGDFPKFENPVLPGSGDGTNLQPQGGLHSPWLAGLPWPYRSTARQTPFRVPHSGGFEAMAITPDGSKLLPLLEKPLKGAVGKNLLIAEFDLPTRRYTGRWYTYAMEPRGTSAPDFVLFSAHRGLVIERDSSSGKLDGLKAIFEVQLPDQAGAVTKARRVDLLRMADPSGISGVGGPGDVGLGDPFAMPFSTIEAVVVLGPDTIGVINDNNFPFSVGRHVGSQQPDDTEFVILRLDPPLETK